MLATLEQSATDIRATLQASEQHEQAANQIEKMAAGAIPLDATWEVLVDSALEQTKQVPYVGIRQTAVNRLLALRRKIRLDLAKSAEEASDKVKSLGEDLRSELEAGALSEARAGLLVNEMKRHAVRVPADDRRSELEAFIQQSEEMLRTRMKEVTLRNLRSRTEKLLASLENEVRNASPAITQERFAQKVDELRKSSAQIAVAASGENIDAGIAALEKEYESSVAARHVAPAPVAAGTAPGESPGSKVHSASGYLDLAKPYLSDLWTWYGLGFLILLMPKRWFAGKDRKKTPPAAPATAGTAPVLAAATLGGPGMPVDDIFSLPPPPPSVPKAATIGPIEQGFAPPRGEDVFGFDTSTPSQPAEPAIPGARIPALPADELVLDSTQDTEDPFGYKKKPASEAPPPAGGPKPALSALPAHEDSDPFAFGADADLVLADMLTARAEVEPGLPPPQPRAAEDFDFAPAIPYSDETPGPQPPSYPTTEPSPGLDSGQDLIALPEMAGTQEAEDDLDEEDPFGFFKAGSSPPPPQPPPPQETLPPAKDEPADADDPFGFNA
jgi:hypothetical protein